MVLTAKFSLPRMNKILRNQTQNFSDYFLVNGIRLNSLQWAGHLMPMGKDEPTQNVYKGNMYEKKVLADPATRMKNKKTDRRRLGRFHAKFGWQEEIGHWLKVTIFCRPCMCRPDYSVRF